MKSQHNCPLCLSVAQLYWQSEKEDYYECKICEAVFLSIQQRLSKSEELERYKLHENNVEDPAYQNFLKPITQAIEKDFSTQSIGLDFGCGSGPVAAKMLAEKDYKVNLFDPYFYNNLENLNQQYDFIICCEVMEHFYQPKKEFEKLNSLLKPAGKLYGKTSLMSKAIKKDFGNWYYKDDPTHVFLYTVNTLKKIKENHQFSRFEKFAEFFVFQK